MHNTDLDNKRQIDDLECVIIMDLNYFFSSDVSMCEWN